MRRGSGDRAAHARVSIRPRSTATRCAASTCSVSVRWAAKVSVSRPANPPVMKTCATEWSCPSWEPSRPARAHPAGCSRGRPCGCRPGPRCPPWPTPSCRCDGRMAGRRACGFCVAHRRVPTCAAPATTSSPATSPCAPERSSARRRSGCWPRSAANGCWCTRARGCRSWPWVASWSTSRAPPETGRSTTSTPMRWRRRPATPARRSTASASSATTPESCAKSSKARSIAPRSW